MKNADTISNVQVASKVQPLDFGEEGFRPARKNWVPAVRTIQLSNNFLCFYIGRDGKAGSPVLADDDNNWGQFDLSIGTACYVLFNGNEAIVIDTLLLPEQAQFVRWRMGKLGVERFTVINTHMDMDHTGGNEVFSDSTIIASKGTYDALVKYKDRIESGTMFGGPPATNPLILPNKLVEKDTDITLAGFDLKLIPINGHQEGGVLCTLVQAYQAMILGDLAEDNAVYVIQPQDIGTHISESRRLLAYDFKYVFPGHGHPDRIARGEYRKRLLEASIVYQERLVEKLNDHDYLDTHFKDFMADYLEDGTLDYHEPYAGVHKGNVKTMYRQYKS